MLPRPNSVMATPVNGCRRWRPYVGASGGSEVMKKLGLLSVLLALAALALVAAQVSNNGVRVAGPKLFDARALILMLEQLERASVVDQHALTEPPRVHRRLQSLRGWSHVTQKQILPRGQRTCRPTGL